MTIEIPDRADFKAKFAALMAANVYLITAGIEPSRDLSKQMIDEFLNQFIMTTPAPAPTKSAGYVVTVLPSEEIPYGFKNNLYRSESDAQLAVSKFIGQMGYGRTSDYKIKEVSYFG
jgi:hypothetical protein